jgi:DNA-binding PadR family transcriptional regulator
MSAMTPAVFHVLLALIGGPRHGYAIMQDVREHTDGSLQLGAGTLYGTIDRLIRDGFVREVEGPAAQSSRDARRRFYRITPDGRRVLDAEVDRLERIVKAARVVRRAAKV